MRDSVRTEDLPQPHARIGAALMLVGASVVLWEILLTRIFSVTLYYHFAFMAVSLAMFGLTFGAVLVFVGARGFAPVELERGLAGLALATGLLMSASIGLQLSAAEGASYLQGHLVLFLVLSFFLAALPFVPAGAFVSLTLTRYRRVGMLYACDLAGAGLGCALVPFAIGGLGGPGAVLLAGAMAVLAAWLVARPSRPALAWGSLGLAACLVAFAAANVSGQWLRVRWRVTGAMPVPLFESWNSFSRVMVSECGRVPPIGMGMPPEVVARTEPIEQLWLQIDAGAATALTAFDGDLERVGFLRYDVSTFAHYLRPGADVCVIGSGGGRDVLAALAFRQRSVLALEVNPDINAAVNGVFGDFTGHLDRRPGVRFVAEEGRSHLARTEDRFDVILASLVDTAAATAAGAFAFTENGLYTVEGWRLFLDRLKPGGILSITRWYYGCAPWPVELYRTMALAAAALRSRGVEAPGRHLLVLRTRAATEASRGEALATIMVSPDPFTEEDLSRVRAACGDLACDVAWSSSESLDPNFAEVLAAREPAALERLFALDVSPPTDDRPYFFFFARLNDLLAVGARTAPGGSQFHLPAVQILGALTLLSIVLGGALVAVPALVMRLRGSWEPSRGTGTRACVLYFAGIGLAFMFVEIGLIQRLSLFLGHPTYGFTVVLFGLLLSGGLGSLASARLRAWLRPSREWWSLLALVAVLVGVEVGSRAALVEAAGATTAVRVLLTLALICPPGFLMGLPFPTGMERIQSLGDPRGPWFWALNGALSVIGSVLAMVVSLAFGIRATLGAGIAIYVVAALLLRSMPEGEAGRPAG